MTERMEKGKWKRRKLERVLLPYMGICTALLVVGYKPGVHSLGNTAQT